MKYCRFQSDSGPEFGQIEQHDDVQWVTRLTDPWADGTGDREIAPRKLSDLQLLVPVRPSKIVCVGRNYRDHAKELGNEVPDEPLLFFKPPSSLLASGAPILLPKISKRVDFEGELAVIIGKRARKLSRQDDWSSYIHGYTLANDVTARDLQKKDGQTTQWTRAKGCDTFCPVGPIVDTELDLTAGLTIQTHLNGQLRQHGSTLDFLFDLPTLLEFITAAMTLEPGDLLLTGTPAGVGPLSAGDIVEVSIPGLGKLSNPVQLDKD